MIIEKDKVVSVSYKLNVKNASQPQERFVEETTADNPLTFLFGSGNLLEAFERNLSGKKVGDKFDFILGAQEGYGVRDDRNVVQIAKANFLNDKGQVEDGLLDIGNSLPMMTQDGQRMYGIVKSVTNEVVEMDFNHPLAGDDLHFAGEVVEVRIATADEISHGHVHGPGGHHH